VVAASRHTTAPISHARPSPVARKLLLISSPAEGRRLSCFTRTEKYQTKYGKVNVSVICSNDRKTKLAKNEKNYALVNETKKNNEKGI